MSAGRSVIAAEGIKDAAWPWSGTRSRFEAGRVIDGLDRLDLDGRAGFVAASWAMIPPTRVSDPTRVSGRPIARIVNGSRRRNAVDIERARDPARPTVRAITRMSSIAIASAPALRSSLRRSSTAAASISPLTVIWTPRPAIGSSPVHARIRPRSDSSWPTEVAPVARSARSSASWFWSVETSARRRSFSVFWLATSGGQLLGRLRLRAPSRRSGRGAGRRQQAEDRRDGGERQLAAKRRACGLTAAARRRGAGRRWRPGAADGSGLGTARDSRRVTEPAKPATSTLVGLGPRDPDPERPAPGPDEFLPARRGRQPGEQVLRPDRGDLVRAGDVGGVDEDRAADVDDRRRRRDPLAVDRDRLGAGLPEERDDGPQVRGADEVVGLVAARRDGLGRVLELQDDPGPGQRDEAGGDPGLVEPVVEVADHGGRAGPLLLDVLDLPCGGRRSAP